MLYVCIIFFGLYFVSGKRVNGYWRNPEENLSTAGIISFFGYPSETHTVTTADGYIIDIHRIPHGKNETFDSDPNRPAILLMHGLYEASSCFVNNLPNESAGFLFADAGFDVWLGNVRGNTYGRKHITLSTKQHDFWKFSWSEHAHLDLNAIFDKIEEVTGQKQIYYLGHSQGTLIMFAQLAENVKFAARIKRFFALAPVGSVKNIKGIIGTIEKVVWPVIDVVKLVLRDIEFRENWIVQKAIEAICSFHFIEHYCADIIYFIAGPEFGNINMSRLDVYLSHAPAGSSTRNMLHWAQLAHTGVMAKYNYRNRWENIKHYGHISPPTYDLGKIDQNLNLHIYSSDIDWLADPEDVADTISKFSTGTVKTNTILPDVSHIDFVWGLNAAPLIYHPIIELVRTLDGI